MEFELAYNDASVQYVSNYGYALVCYSELCVMNLLQNVA